MSRRWSRARGECEEKQHRTKTILDLLKRGDVDGLNELFEGHDSLLENVRADLDERRVRTSGARRRRRTLSSSTTQVICSFLIVYARGTRRARQRRWRHTDQAEIVVFTLTGTPEKSVEFDGANGAFEFLHVGFIVPWLNLRRRRAKKAVYGQTRGMRLTSRTMLLLAMITGSTGEVSVRERETMNWFTV